MRKIIFLIHVSLDGYVAGPDGEMDWMVYNEDLAQYSYSLHDSTDTAIYGRVTYQMMEAYWPQVLKDPESAGGELAHAQWADKATKIVASTTLDSVEWNNTVIFKENVAQQIADYKQQAGKDIWLLGSPTLAQTLMQQDLIDEYRLNINPVILGRGIKLFTESDRLKSLNLVSSKTFEGGVVALIYEPDRAER